MLPRLATCNERDGGRRHAMLLGKFGVSYSCAEPQKNCAHGFFREPSVSVPASSGHQIRMSPGTTVIAPSNPVGMRLGSAAISSGLSILRNHVIHVVLLRAREEVTRIAAQRCVAVMAQVRSLRYRTDRDGPCKSVGKPMATRNPQAAISDGCSSKPDPARPKLRSMCRDRTVLVDPRPEHISRRWALTSVVAGACAEPRFCLTSERSTAVFARVLTVRSALATTLFCGYGVHVESVLSVRPRPGTRQRRRATFVCER